MGTGMRSAAKAMGDMPPDPHKNAAATERNIRKGTHIAAAVNIQKAAGGEMPDDRKE